jgi:UDP-N-acetylmuramoyl-tripeptide--D-alanyl-D-alanine ligase
MAAERHASCAIVSKADSGIDLPQFVCADTRVALVKIAKLFRSQFIGTVIAISGSFGKTTTKDILRLLLAVGNNATFGNLNGDLGVPMTLATLNNDEIFAVIEVAVDRPGDMDILAPMVSPHIAIVTGIGKAHMRNMGSEEGTAREKCKLVGHAIANGGCGIFTGECLRFDYFRGLREGSIVVEEGSPSAGYGVRMCRGRTLVNVMLDGQSFPFAVPRMMSPGTIKDFALACLCALRCGVQPEAIGKRIARWEPTPMRGEIVKSGERTYFMDCYNANPTSFRDSCEHFDRLFPHGNRLLIIGALMEEEIGPTAADENAALLENFPVRRGDCVIIIGDGVEQLAKKVCRCHSRAFALAEEARHVVESFRGVVYLKGHRHYRLETLVFGAQ